MYEIFFVIGLTIFIGFVTTTIFERTRISEVIPLMLFGLILGPILHTVDVSPNSIIVSILPFISTLALIVLLFHAGLMMDIFAVARAITKSTIFTVAVFVITLALITIFSILVLQWPVMHGILLGVVLGGTGSAIVVTMIEKARIKEETKSLLILESIITDALCIIIAGIIIQLIVSSQTPELPTMFNTLLSSFTIAVFLGILCAGIWTFIVKYEWLSRYSYMLILALVFCLFGITETLKGNGGFAVLVFGIILGNMPKLKKILKFKNEAKISPLMLTIQEEIAFFVRTFFFVYIGLILSPSNLSGAVMIVSLVLLSIMLTSRLAVQKAFLPNMPQKEKNILVTMLPRGLAAAVLATIPTANGIYISSFQQIVFSVILLSNIFTTLAIFIFDRKEGKNKKEDKGEGAEKERGPVPVRDEVEPVGVKPAG